MKLKIPKIIKQNCRCRNNQIVEIIFIHFIGSSLSRRFRGRSMYQLARGSEYENLIGPGPVTVSVSTPSIPQAYQTYGSISAENINKPLSDPDLHVTDGADIENALEAKDKIC